MAYKHNLIAKTKNLYDGLNHYAVSKNWPADKKIWTGDIAVTCCFSFYQNLSDVNSPSGALFRFEYSDNSVSYRVPVNQTGLVRADAVLYPTENKRLIGISIVNYSSSTGDVYNMLLEKGSSMTTYVPYDYLPSYKSKLKVANVCQLMDKSTYPSTATLLGVTFTNNGDGTIVVNGATEAVYVNYPIQMPRFKTVTNDHKYVLFSGIENIDVSYVECLLWIGRADSTYFVKDCVETGFEGTFGFIIPQGNYPLYQKVELRIRAGYTANNLVFKPQLIDLTESYGAGHEPTTVAEFRAKFPNELYPYTPKCWLTSYKHNLIATTKNLLSYSETTAEFPETDWENTNPRDLSEGVWYVATSANNYTIKHTVADYKIERNLLYINVAQAAYGLSRAFKCNPGEVYNMSVRGKGNIQLGVGFFDMSGNYLSYVNENASSLLFTTPTNCKWFWVNFTANQDNSKVYFRDIQLEKGSSPTDYVPNGYL